MKTNLKAQTGNNLLKTTAVIILASLLSVGVRANGVEKANNRGMISETGFSAEFILIDQEESLALEAWMTDESNFFLTLNVAEEIEDALGMESWMTSESTFSNLTLPLQVETDEALTVEGWMKNESYGGESVDIETETEEILKMEFWMTGQGPFCNSSSFLQVDTDNVLTIEDWMKNDNCGSNSVSFDEETDDPLKLESWMTNLCVGTI